MATQRYIKQYLGDNKVINAKKVYTCRLCGSIDLVSFFSTGEIYINDFPSTPSGNRGKVDMTLTRCEKCSLIQLDQTVDSEVYFDYWYESKLNKKIINNLKDIVTTARNEVTLEKDDLVLDIGANDGTLLSFYEDLPVIRIGCDPAKSIQNDLTKHCEYNINDLWNKQAWDNLPLSNKKAKIITAIAMFYDLDYPNEFVQSIKKVLHQDGVFIVQLMPAVPMLMKFDIGNVCHEHLLYYTYQSLVRLFKQQHLEIYNVKENDINGGSYQLWIRHASSLNGSLFYPEQYAPHLIEKWVKQVKINKENTINFIRQKVKEGKNVYFYGASTKGNTIAQWYGLTSKDIKGAAEIHPNKIGRYMVGSQIPIVDEKEARKDADYFLVTGFGFKDIFIKKEKEFLEKGGKLIFCTPTFEIISNQ
jgi:NDP-4-keto-2,6-dideoxyhexose 3-C-methyltransferase